MKRKIIIISAILIVLSAGIAALTFMSKNREIPVYLGDREAAAAFSLTDDKRLYISAEDIFRAADADYETSGKGIRVKGNKTLEINKESNEVKINGEKSAYDYITENNKIMISPYLAGEIIGREAAVMDDRIYMIEIKPVFVKFRENNREIEFGYSDDMFAPSSLGYNHALAKMSLGMAVAAFSSKESDKNWGESGNYGREENIVRLYKDMGFDNIKVYNYDKSLNDTTDKTAFAIAEKNVKLNGKTYRLVAAAIRGGAYGNEWVSNFNLGSGVNHLGFSAAAKEVKSAVEAYIGEKNKNVKLWITGYSRGAAVANITAAELADTINRENIYAYTFATPNGTAYKERNDEKYGYIYNIISDNDLVPLVAPSRWGYGRFGHDVKFPHLSDYSANAAENESNKIGEIYKNISSAGELDLMEIENSNQSEQVKTTVESICTAIGSRDNYIKGVSNILMDFIECGNTKIKDKKGNWKWVSAKEGILIKFKKDGKEILNQAEKDGFLKSIEDKFGEIGKQVKAFGAICIENGRDPYKVITKEIGITNLITVASIVAPVSGESGTIAKAHYPESYIAMMMGLGNPELLIIK